MSPRLKESRESPGGSAAESPNDVSAAELLELLGDEYTREVLLAVVDRPRSATNVAAVTSVSKTTAFRRLDRLEEAGLVQRRSTLDPEHGQHYDEFRARFDRLSVRLDGLTVTVERDPGNGDEGQ